MRITESEFRKHLNDYTYDRLIDKDDIDTRIPKNKEAYLKILEILDKNNIPYHVDPKLDKQDGMPDYSIDVLIEDIPKAQKLTGKLNEVLRKTSS